MKIEIELRNKAYIRFLEPENRNLLDRIVTQIIDTCTFHNPQYEKMLRLSYKRPIKKFPSEFIYTYEMKDDSLIVGIGALDRIIPIFIENNCEYSIKDNRIVKPFYFNLKGLTPRNYQEKYVGELVKAPISILLGPAASGKTIMGLLTLHKLKQRSLILVYNKELLRQWIDFLQKFTDLQSIGILGAGRCKVAPVTVALFQSLMRMDENEIYDFQSNFSTIICDEVHRTPSPVIYKIVNLLHAKNKYGLTATLARRDRMDFLIYEIFSKRIIEIPLQEVAPYISQVYVCFIEDDSVSWDGPSNPFANYWHELLEVLQSNESRNELLISLCKYEIQFKKRQGLLISERIEHCKNLYKKALASGLDCELVLGEISNWQRDRAVKRFNEGKLSLIIGTRALLSEGIDLKPAKFLVLGLPYSRNQLLLRQICGRLSRKFLDHTGVVYDIVDKKIDYLNSLAKAREYIYSKFFTVKKGVMEHGINVRV